MEAQNRLRAAQDATIRFRTADLELQQQELGIQNLIATGAITESVGKEATLAIQRQYRDVLIESLEIQKNAINPILDPEKLARLNIEIEKLKSLGLELSPSQAFFKGLRSEAETTAEAFQRIGANLKDKFLGVLDSGIDRLTKKFGFFKDLIGDILKSLTRKIVSQLFGGGQQGGGGASGGSGGGGIGGFLGNLFGGLFGGNRQSATSQGGSLANAGSALSGGGANLGSFLTGGFSGGNPAAAILGGSGGGGGGLNLGALIQKTLGGNLSNIAAPSPLNTGGSILPDLGKLKGGNVIGFGQGGILASLGGLFKGFGFGKAPGSALGGLASAAPLLGLSLGAGLGGSSVLGSILGAAGGLALGVGLTAAPAALAGTFLAPLFSNPITAIIGGVALIGALLLGRAAARRKDEKSSGDALQQAVDQIHDFRDQIKGDHAQATVGDAHKILESTIIGPFIAFINTIKTRSVRESRLAHQVPDLRKLFETEVIPEIIAQQTRIKNKTIGQNIIPEFATGGVVEGVDRGYDSILAKLRPREMVLTVEHQAKIREMAGHNIFQVVGVPGVGMAPQPTQLPIQPFSIGGVVQNFLPQPASDSGPIYVNISVNNTMSEGEATAIVETSMRGSRGRGSVYAAVKKENGFRSK